MVVLEEQYIAGSFCAFEENIWPQLFSGEQKTLRVGQQGRCIFIFLNNFLLCLCLPPIIYPTVFFSLIVQSWTSLKNFLSFLSHLPCLLDFLLSAQNVPFFWAWVEDYLILNVSGISGISWVIGTRSWKQLGTKASPMTSCQEPSQAGSLVYTSRWAQQLYLK